MAGLSNIFSGFGWAEIIIIFLIGGFIVGINEWKRIKGLFNNGSSTKKQSTHTEE